MGIAHDANWLIGEQQLACWLFAIERVYRKETGTQKFPFKEAEQLKHRGLSQLIGALEDAKRGKGSWDGKPAPPDRCDGLFREDLPAKEVLLWWITASEWLRTWNEFVNANGQPGGPLLSPPVAQLRVEKKRFLYSGPQRRGGVDLLSALLAVSPWGTKRELHPIEWCFRHGATYDLRSEVFREDPSSMQSKLGFCLADNEADFKLRLALVKWVKLPSRQLSFAGWPALNARTAIDTYKRRFSFFSHDVGELIAGATPGGELLRSPPSDWDCHASMDVQDQPIGAVRPTRIDKNKLNVTLLQGTLLHGSLTGLEQRCDADLSEGVPSALRWAYQDFASGSLKDAVEYLRGDGSLLSRHAFLGARYFWAFEAVYGKRRGADGNSDVIAKSALWELAALVAEGLRAKGLDLSVQRLTPERMQTLNGSAVADEPLRKKKKRVRAAAAYCDCLRHAGLVEGGDQRLASCFVEEADNNRWLGVERVEDESASEDSLAEVASQLWRGRLRYRKVRRSEKGLKGLEFWRFLLDLWINLEREAYRTWREVASETSPAYPPRSVDGFPKVSLTDLLETDVSWDVANRIAIRFQKGGVFGEYVGELFDSEQAKPAIFFHAGDLVDEDVRLLNRAFSTFPTRNAELGDNPPACGRAFDEILRRVVLKAISSTMSPCVQIRKEIEDYSWGHEDGDEFGEFNQFVHLAIRENDDSAAMHVAKKWLTIWIEDLGAAVHPRIDVKAYAETRGLLLKVVPPSDGDGVKSIWEDSEHKPGSELRVVFARSGNLGRRYFSRGRPGDGDLVRLSGRIGRYGREQAGPIKEVLGEFDNAVCAWKLRNASELGVGKTLARLLDVLLAGKWVGESVQADVFTLLSQWCAVSATDLFPPGWSPSEGGVVSGGREDFTVRFDETVPMGNLVVQVFGLKGSCFQQEFEGYLSAGPAPDGYAELAELSCSVAEVSGELPKLKSLVDDFPGVVWQRHQDCTPGKHPHLRGDAVELFQQVWLLEKPEPSGHDDVTKNVYGRAVINLLKQVCGVEAFWPNSDDGLAWFADSKENPHKGFNCVTKWIRPALKTQDGRMVLAANVEVSE